MNIKVLSAASPLANESPNNEPRPRPSEAAMLQQHAIRIIERWRQAAV